MILLRIVEMISINVEKMVQNTVRLNNYSYDSSCDIDGLKIV